jgi:hypothetical protein
MIYLIIFFALYAFVLLLGKYDCLCFRYIISPMGLDEFGDFLRGPDGRMAIRFCGSIYLWHRKYKYQKPNSLLGGQHPPQQELGGTPPGPRP